MTDALPPDWQEEVDDSSGRVYYANYATNEVTWTRPTGTASKTQKVTPTVVPAVARPVEPKVVKPIASTTAAAAANSLPPGWVSAQDSGGNTYYINEQTNESTWDRPTSEQAAAQAVAVAKKAAKAAKPRPSKPKPKPTAHHTAAAGGGEMSEAVEGELERLRVQVAALSAKADKFAQYLANKQMLARLSQSSKASQSSMATRAGKGAAGGASPLAQGVSEEARHKRGFQGALSPAIACEQIFYSGWGEKEGGSIKNWKRRFFVLYGDRIEYFQSPSSTSSKGSIPLAGCSVKSAQTKEGRPVIHLTNDAKRKYQLLMDSPEESAIWFVAIHSCIIAAEYQKKSAGKPDPRVLKFLLTAMNRDILKVSAKSVEVKPTTLCLNNKPLSKASVHTLCRILADEHCTPVKTFECVNASLSAKDVEAIVEALCKNKRHPTRVLNVSGNNVGLSWSLALLAGKSQVSDVIAEMCNVTDADLEFLAKKVVRGTAHCSVQHIELAQNQISCNGVQALPTALQACASSLVYLGLNDNSVGDRGGEVLGQMLASFTSLLFLSLRANQVGDSGAEAIADALSLGDQHLLMLDLGLNSRIGKSGSTALSHMAQANETLERLSFSGHELELQGLTVLRMIYRYGLAQATDA